MCDYATFLYCAYALGGEVIYIKKLCNITGNRCTKSWTHKGARRNYIPLFFKMKMNIGTRNNNVAIYFLPLSLIPFPSLLLPLHPL